jgi:hypothetical protein
MGGVGFHENAPAECQLLTFIEVLSVPPTAIAPSSSSCSAKGNAMVPSRVPSGPMLAHWHQREECEFSEGSDAKAALKVRKGTPIRCTSEDDGPWLAKLEFQSGEGFVRPWAAAASRAASARLVEWEMGVSPGAPDPQASAFISPRRGVLAD